MPCFRMVDLRTTAMERRAHGKPFRSDIQGFDDARHVLTRAVERMEREGR
ncbi:MAG TPA: hypothetical protein VMS17_27010 [Gemmataceae bacterium]|nr:hypothetical protein [Gemmataceae bacterium]